MTAKVAYPKTVTSHRLARALTHRDSLRRPRVSRGASSSSRAAEAEQQRVKTQGEGRVGIELGEFACLPGKDRKLGQGKGREPLAPGRPSSIDREAGRLSQCVATRVADRRAISCKRLAVRNPTRTRTPSSRSTGSSAACVSSGCSPRSWNVAGRATAMSRNAIANLRHASRQSSPSSSSRKRLEQPVADRGQELLATLEVVIDRHALNPQL